MIYASAFVRFPIRTCLEWFASRLGWNSGIARAWLYLGVLGCGGGQEPAGSPISGAGMRGMLAGARALAPIAANGGAGSSGGVGPIPSAGVGSAAEGRSGDMQGLAATCQDWTSKAKEGGKPRCGLSWPRGNLNHWISTLNEGGCLPRSTAPGAEGGPQGTVGAFGGYGGFYCFALTP